MLKRISLALVLAFVVVLPAMAQDFQKGLAAAKRGDHVIALKEWRPLAEQGHAVAQYNVAQMYFPMEMASRRTMPRPKNGTEKPPGWD